MSETIDRLTAIFHSVFDDDELTINRGTSAADIENWDSLTHVSLIIKVEREFQVRFSSSEVSSLQTVGELIDLIEKKVSK